MLKKFNEDQRTGPLGIKRIHASWAGNRSPGLAGDEQVASRVSELRLVARPLRLATVARTGGYLFISRGPRDRTRALVHTLSAKDMTACH